MHQIFIISSNIWQWWWDGARKYGGADPVELRCRWASSFQFVTKTAQPTTRSNTGRKTGFLWGRCAVDPKRLWAGMVSPPRTQAPIVSPAAHAVKEHAPGGIRLAPSRARKASSPDASEHDKDEDEVANGRATSSKPVSSMGDSRNGSHHLLANPTNVSPIHKQPSSQKTYFARLFLAGAPRLESGPGCKRVGRARPTTPCASATIWGHGTPLCTIAQRSQG